MSFESIYGKKNVILAIETAIEGGSLALFRGGFEIACWSGNTAISQAEDFLEQIRHLLESNQIEKKHLQMIGVSNGPGSSTGTKIGLSIARGLCNALGIGWVEVSVFEALLEQVPNIEEGAVMTVIPARKNFVHRRIFGNLKFIEQISSTEMRNQMPIKIEEFKKQIENLDYKRIIYYRKNFENDEILFDSNLRASVEVVLTNKNPASMIADKLIAKIKNASDNL